MINYISFFSSIANLDPEITSEKTNKIPWYCAIIKDEERESKLERNRHQKCPSASIGMDANAYSVPSSHQISKVKRAGWEEDKDLIPSASMSGRIGSFRWRRARSGT